MIPSEAYGWHSWKDVFRELALGSMMGIAVSFIESGGTRAIPELDTLGRNALIGACIMGLSRLLETLLSWAIEQSKVPILFRSLLYAIGGWMGYFLGIGLANYAFGEQDDVFSFRSYHFVYSLTAAALISMLIGFVLHHNRKRNLRLQQSIERLKEHEFAEKELEIARDMQRRLLPPPRIERADFVLSARTEAAHMVGGDFYEVVELADGSVAVVVADVSGKGMAASLIMASCKAVIPFMASGKSAQQVVHALNNKLCNELGKREFVALTYVHFHPSTGEASLVNAGMPEPLLIQAHSVRPLSSDGPRLPLGIREDLAYIPSTFQMDLGDKLFLFSDGLPEAMAGEEALGYERVRELVGSLPQTSDPDALDRLLASVRAIPSLQLTDDFTVLLLERREAQPSRQAASLVS